MVEESGVSNITLRYFKAGILLRIQAEEQKKSQSLPSRILQAIDEEIDRLKLLSEERWFKGLKPIDAFFDIIEEKPSAAKPAQTMKKPDVSDAVHIFCCYSHDDLKLVSKMHAHLSSLKRQNLAAVWHDRKITPGEEWEGQIDRNLNSAHIVLLIVSASFINSDYCYDIEMKRALERHYAGECYVIPIILKDCDWKDAPFGRLEALPTKGQAVTGRTWKNVDEAFTNVANGIRKVIANIRA